MDHPLVCLFLTRVFNTCRTTIKFCAVELLLGRNCVFATNSHLQNLISLKTNGVNQRFGYGSKGAKYLPKTTREKMRILNFCSVKIFGKLLRNYLYPHQNKMDP